MPSLRLLSVTGAQCSEDMLCSVLVDAFFNELEGRQVAVVSSSNSDGNNNNNSSNKDETGNSKSDEGDNSKNSKNEEQRARSAKMLTTTTTSSSSKSQNSADSIPLLSDEKMRQVVAFVNEMVALRSSSLDTLLQRAQTSLKNGLCPPLSDSEFEWSPPVVAAVAASTSATIGGDEKEGGDNDGGENKDDDESFTFEGEDEGAEEEAASKIPNEQFGSKK